MFSESLLVDFLQLAVHVIIPAETGMQRIWLNAGSCPT